MEARPQSVLVATAVAEGSQEPYFASATGLDFGVTKHRFDGAIHTMAPEDDRRLHRAIAEGADHDARFWAEYLTRAGATGDRLIGAARGAVSRAEQPAGRGALGEAFSELCEAIRATTPFALATSAALDVLTDSAALHLGAERLGAESAPANTELSVSELSARLRASWAEPEAVRMMRSLYRIALAVRGDKAALEAFVTTAPGIALDRVRRDFPDLDRLIWDHLDQYGWLRTRGYHFEPLSAETLVYQIQLALIRWPAEGIEQAAASAATPGGQLALGFAPSEALAGLAGVVQSMSASPVFRVDLLLRAECIARPFLARVAAALGCTPKQVLMASVDEVAGALAGEQDLPLSEIDARAHRGFTLRRDGTAAVVATVAAPSTGGAYPAAAGGALQGMTACRGTAVGRVRIVLDQEALLGVEYGDVLVTAASTIDPTDYEDNPTVFPTRNAGPHADALQRAAAVVADEGGLLSHAAIVCRELGLPCVLGAEVATTTLVEGQVVEVDATKPVGFVIPV